MLKVIEFFSTKVCMVVATSWTIGSTANVSRKMSIAPA
jgi:hypothetical protein